MKVVAIIPARYASTRFPGKPLVNIHGKTMIERVYGQVRKCELVSKALVATDDERILKHVLEFGGDAMLTSAKHKSGTDRCAEALAKLQITPDIIINVQGDEPFIQTGHIETLIHLMNNEKVKIGTLVSKIREEGELFSEHVVKAVIDKYKKALLFSRAAVPHLRGIEREKWLDHFTFFRHIGMYGFKRDTLIELKDLPVSNLEKAESLEQLRWMENGYSIFTAIIDKPPIGIDTPEDLVKVEDLLREGKLGLEPRAKGKSGQL
jgi:3-deoxy-manno-octulosonate cytidylyltransferase (CMP-KDO synthetase)